MPVLFDKDIERELHELRASVLDRRPHVLGSSQQPEVLVDGRRVIGLCSNNYLGLADHPDLVAAAEAALRAYGVGAAASRLVSGTMDLHLQAEQRLTRFVGLESGLLFSSGYAANTGAIQALAGSSDVLFSDSLNHASIIDGCRLSRARVEIYRHCDPAHLQQLLSQRRAGSRRALVISEAVFSMDGDMAPLPELRHLCDLHNAALYVDEAHALGVLGRHGQGLCAYRHIRPDVLVGTLGKAFGAAGGFVAGSANTVDIIKNRARSYFFSTAPLPVQAALALSAADLVERADDRRERLLGHAARLRRALSEMGYEIPDGTTPIIPILVGEPEAVMRLSACLLEKNVFVQGIRPPTVPRGTSRLRLAPIASHQESHIDRAIDAFRSALPDYLSSRGPQRCHR